MWRRNWVPKPAPVCAPAISPGMSATTKLLSAGGFPTITTPRLGCESGEGVIGDLRPRRGNARDQSGLAHVRISHQSHIRQQLQFQAEDPLLAGMAVLVFARGAVHGGGKARIAASAASAAGHDDALVGPGKVVDLLAACPRRRQWSRPGLSAAHLRPRGRFCSSLRRGGRARALYSGLKRKCTSVLWRSLDSMMMSPPRPPSPPEGPPRGTNFSRRKAMQPLPPSPAFTRIVASSMNIGNEHQKMNAEPCQLPDRSLRAVVRREARPTGFGPRKSPGSSRGVRPRSQHSARA